MLGAYAIATISQSAGAAHMQSTTLVLAADKGREEEMGNWGIGGWERSGAEERRGAGRGHCGPKSELLRTLAGLQFIFQAPSSRSAEAPISPIAS